MSEKKKDEIITCYELKKKNHFMAARIVIASHGVTGVVVPISLFNIKSIDGLGRSINYYSDHVLLIQTLIISIMNNC